MTKKLFVNFLAVLLLVALSGVCWGQATPQILTSRPLAEKAAADSMVVQTAIKMQSRLLCQQGAVLYGERTTSTLRRVCGEGSAPNIFLDRVRPVQIFSHTGGKYLVVMSEDGQVIRASTEEDANGMSRDIQRWGFPFAGMLRIINSREVKTPEGTVTYVRSLVNGGWIYEIALVHGESNARLLGPAMMPADTDPQFWVPCSHMASTTTGDKYCMVAEFLVFTKTPAFQLPSWDEQGIIQANGIVSMTPTSDGGMIALHRDEVGQGEIAKLTRVGNGNDFLFRLISRGQTFMFGSETNRAAMVGNKLVFANTTNNGSELLSLNPADATRGFLAPTFSFVPASHPSYGGMKPTITQVIYVE